MAWTNPYPNNPKLSELYRSFNRLHSIANAFLYFAICSLLITIFLQIGEAFIAFIIFSVIALIIHSLKNSIGEQILNVQDALEAVKHEINDTWE